MWLSYPVTVDPLIQQGHKLRQQRARNASLVQTVEMIPLPWGGEQLMGSMTEVLGSNCTKGKLDVSIIRNVHLGSTVHSASYSRGPQKGVPPGAP